MKQPIRNLLIFNIVFIIWAVTIFAIGFEYDKANQLYPETVQVSYDLSMGGVFGPRWIRFLKISTLFLVIFDIVIGFILYRRNQNDKRKIPLLNIE